MGQTFDPCSADILPRSGSRCLPKTSTPNRSLTSHLNAKPADRPVPSRRYNVYAVFRTLQEAADAAHGGDLVAVMPGSYAGFVLEDKPSAGDGRYIHFKAMGQPGDVVIDRASRNPDWMILLRATHHVIIDGFNLAGHNAPELDPLSPRAGIMLDGDFGLTGNRPTTSSSSIISRTITENGGFTLATPTQC